MRKVSLPFYAPLLIVCIATFTALPNPLRAQNSEETPHTTSVPHLQRNQAEPWPSAATVQPDKPSPPVKQLCKPALSEEVVVATPIQRKRAGESALPPLTDENNGFAWPDTEFGIIRNGSTYTFFASDGAYHARQNFEGVEEGNNKYGSITRTIGTLDHPLGTEPPIDVTIRPNPDPAVNPYYASYDYMGGGPVYRVPTGKPGAGNLLMLYHAEIPTITTQSFYSVLALAASTDNGLSWIDLGEIIRINQGYRTDMDGYDIGDPNLLVSPDGHFYVYFADWLANGTTHWLTTINFLAVARAPIDAVLDAAFDTKHPHAAAFQKRYDGFALDQALGGYSRDLANPDAGYWGPVHVNWNADLKRYQAIIDNGNLIAYAESPDGFSWSAPTVLKDFTNDPNHPGFYTTPIGLGDDPNVLGNQFYILYTYYPNNGQGWNGATVRRFTVTCKE